MGERVEVGGFQQAYLHGKPFFIRGLPAEDMGDLNGMRAFWVPNDVNRPHGAGNMEVIPYSQLRKDAPECVEFELPTQTVYVSRNLHPRASNACRVQQGGQSTF